MKKKFNERFWKYIGNYGDKDISAMEVFYECEEEQEFEGVKFIIKEPYMLLEFKYEDTILALYIMCFKTIWGFNNPKHFKFFLNEIEFSSKNLDSEDKSPEEEIEEFILKNEENIKEVNLIKIEIVRSINIEYCKHMIITFNNEVKIEDFFIKNKRI
jgi:hypothetical protein